MAMVMQTFANIHTINKQWSINLTVHVYDIKTHHSLVTANGYSLGTGRPTQEEAS